MEISSLSQEDRFGGRTLSDISISRVTSGKGQNLSSAGGFKHVRDTRVKFLCSYGGKILPRPSDKRLRYVGGDTRMISVPRHIRLTALRLKLAEVYGHDVTLKYQLPEEDLDALVSVSSEEDLENMMEECDRLDVTEGSSRLRVFVFSSDKDAIDFNDVADPKASEHRYVEAVNTVKADVPSSRPIENVFSSDMYKNSSGNAWKVPGTQDGFPGTSENLHSHAYPLEQCKPAGNYAFSVLTQKNNLVGHIAPPSHVAIAKPRNELTSPGHANNSSFHGPPVAVDDFLDLESGESACSSTSSQQDLFHRSRNSKSKIQSHLDQIAYRIHEDQISRAEPRVQWEAKIDSSTSATSIAPILQPSEPTYSPDATSRDKNGVYEDQPLSPGALLQRQLQVDQSVLETGLMQPFVNQISQSTLDGNENQLQVSHERPQIEDLPLRHLVINENIQGVLADGHLLSEPLKIPVKVPLSQAPSFLLFPDGDRSPDLVQSETIEKPVILLQQVDLQDTFLHPAAIPVDDFSKSPHNNDVGEQKVGSELAWQPCADSSLLAGLQTNILGINKLHKLDKSTAPGDNVPTTGMGTEHTWLVPDLVSFPPRDDPYVNILDDSTYQTHVSNSTSLKDKQIVGAGLSLLDEPIDYTDGNVSAAVPDVELDLTSTTMRDTSMLDIKSTLLPSALTVNCSSPPADPLFTTLVEPLPKLGKDQARLSMAVDALSLDPVSENTRIGILDDVDAFQQPVYQESAVCFGIDDIRADIYKKGIGAVDFEEGTAALTREDTLESSVMEGNLIIETTKLEDEEQDALSSVADRPMNYAALAEAEAIARGLQTIRNFDLEELRELGSGTFGTVYHGKWRGTDVAIKRIKPSCFTGRPSERERLIADFWQEAFILGQLHHPNVVAFYGVVPDGPGGTLATVTEYMVNGSLKQALHKKDRILDRRKRLMIAMDAAFGMEYLHKKNVVHFDLKGENLLVNLRDIQRPICKVGDLGLSKVKQQTMISGGVRGTLPWMAPELLNGSSSLVSEKVDVFSFGIVLWELLTGEEPYTSMHYGAIIGGIVTNTLRPPVPTWCDPAWRSIMEACWAADPSERPNFTEIASSLRTMEAALNAKGQVQAQNVE